MRFGVCLCVSLCVCLSAHVFCVCLGHLVFDVPFDYVWGHSCDVCVCVRMCARACVCVRVGVVYVL